MKITWRVKEVAEARGITSPRDLSWTTRLYKETCKRLWDGTAQEVNLKVLQQVCQGLRCEPNDVLNVVYHVGDKPPLPFHLAQPEAEGVRLASEAPVAGD